MLHPSTQKLIEKLIEMTEDSKIAWQEGDEETCFYDTEGYRVTVGQSPSRLVLQDASGRVLETVSDALLSASKDVDGLSYSLKIEKLVSDVRRQLTGVDAIIDSIVSALDLDGDADSDDDGGQYDMMFPDQSEMASRVALLAEKVNSKPPVYDDVEDEDENAGEPDLVEVEPVAVETVETVEDDIAAAEPPETPVEQAETGELKEAPVEEVSGDAITGLSDGLTSLGAAATTSVEETSLSEKSGMIAPETYDEGEGWTIPPDAEIASVEAVDDYISTEGFDEPVTQFSPVETVLGKTPIDSGMVVEEVVAADIEPSGDAPEAEPEAEPVKPASFGMIGAFGAEAVEVFVEAEPASEELVDDGLPMVDDLPPEPLIEPLVHAAAEWSGEGQTLDARAIVPAYLITPLPVEEIAPEPDVPVKYISDAEPEPDLLDEGQPIGLTATPLSVEPFEAPAVADETIETVLIEGIEFVEVKTVTPEAESVVEADEPVIVEAEAEAEVLVEASPETAEAEVAEEPKEEPPPTRRTIYKYNPWM